MNPQLELILCRNTLEPNIDMPINEKITKNSNLTVHDWNNILLQQKNSINPEIIYENIGCVTRVAR